MRAWLITISVLILSASIGILLGHLAVPFTAEDLHDIFPEE